jgi:hypothetical protein
MTRPAVDSTTTWTTTFDATDTYAIRAEANGGTLALQFCTKHLFSLYKDKCKGERNENVV